MLALRKNVFIILTCLSDDYLAHLNVYKKHKLIVTNTFSLIKQNIPISAVKTVTDGDKLKKLNVIKPHNFL